MLHRPAQHGLFPAGQAPAGHLLPDPDVLEVGVEMVRFLAPCYITYILIELLTGAIRGRASR
ncbi:hypothetical protein M5E87_07750 [Flavonifractor plautii]|nr:hypothetical protein M5E87_07750 [Flavonifractor plautii]